MRLKKTGLLGIIQSSVDTDLEDAQIQTQKIKQYTSSLMQTTRLFWLQVRVLWKDKMTDKHSNNDDPTHNDIYQIATK
jgi:hypothetical protein